jgi:hypothetical protein
MYANRSLSVMVAFRQLEMRGLPDSAFNCWPSSVEHGSMPSMSKQSAVWQVGRREAAAR